MPVREPATTALLLGTFGALLVISVVFGRVTQRFSVPAALVFLIIGMLAGSEGLGGIAFDNYQVAYRLGTIALVLILFDGGLNTPLGAIRGVLAPSVVLATIGVIGTAALTAVAARVWGFPWEEAMVLGAVVSSTDAAAVFASLRSSGIQLKRRVGATLEAESGMNDPMAVILTAALTANLVRPGAFQPGQLLLEILIQIGVGFAFGLALGYAGRWAMARLRLSAGGLYAAFTVALACLAFGLPTLFQGSGFVSVYLAGIVLGNGPLPLRSGLLRVHDALAWLSQITMFLLLGLLVFPSKLPEVASAGIVIALALTFVARPLIVTLCLLPFRYPRVEIGYISWVGLRGAVPIILATYPVLAGAPGAARLFNLVFFIVVVGAILPGMTVAWVARALRLQRPEPPTPPAVLAIESREPLAGELLSFYIDDRLAVAGSTVDDVPLPDGTAITLIIRGAELIPPRGSTVLKPGDHVYVVTRREDRSFVQLLFGRPEEE